MKKTGSDLDKFWAAVFLEKCDKAITALERKQALVEIDSDSNGRMACIEYLTWKFKKSVSQVVNSPQGDNSAAIAAAQKKLDAVMAQLNDCENKLEAQKKAKEDNEKAIAQLKQAEADLQTAQAELEAAIQELKAQEAAYKAKCDALEATINDPSTSGMKKSKSFE